MARSTREMTGSGSEVIRMHRLNWPGSADPEVMALVFSLQRAHEITRSQARAVWAKHGLTPAEFDVLATLRRSAPPHELTPSGIQNAQVITSGGLTKVMLNLESRGLVSRSRHEQDQRIRPVRLSAGGKRLVQRAMTELTSVTGSAIRTSLTAPEISDLTALLNKLIGSRGGRPLTRCP